MAGGPKNPGTGRRVVPADIDRALAQGAERDRRLGRALRIIDRTMERDPESLARVLRRWMQDG
jgi:flagellar biosynthesis/type III secretory pathway M-ring protein FliF/YscJ